MGAWRYVGSGRPEAWVAGHMPWPCVAQVEGNVAPAPMARSVNEAPPSALYALDNAMWLANAARAREALAAREGSGPRWVEAHEVPFRPRLGGPERRLREVFEAFRAAGVDPHGLGEEWDAHVAAILLGPLFGDRPEPDVPPSEHSVPPDPGLVVAQGEFPRVVALTEEGERQGSGFQWGTRQRLGSCAQMVAEVAAMGFGRVRRVGQCDTFWGSLAPEDEGEATFYNYGQPIPKPYELQALLVDTNFHRFAAAALLTITGWIYGVRVDLTLFTAGGGSPLNQKAAFQTDEPFPDPTGSWATFFGYAPAWHAGALIFSRDRFAGWDAWYFDHTGSAPSDPERYYQRWALNVWPSDSSATSEVVSAYRQECARRKALGVAAFSDAVAQWLVALDAAWSGVGVGLEQVVDTLELGNELNAFWVIPTPPTATDTPASDDAELEAGRFLALLAGPVRARFPSGKAPRFRTELTGWQWQSTGDNYSAQLRWLERTLTRGMVGEVSWWSRLQIAKLLSDRYAVAMPAEEQAWWDTAAEAGFAWPPDPGTSGFLSLLAGDLLQQVGAHWFHEYDTDAGSNADALGAGYADTPRLGSDIAALTRSVITASAAAGFRLQQSLCAVPYPAEAPPKEKSARYGNAFFDRANRRHQAGMLLRAFAVAGASGVEPLGVFTFYFGEKVSSTRFPEYTLSTWTDFDCTGVHNEVLSRGQTTTQGGTLWRRSSWYTLRRLVWLRHRASAWTLRVNERGLTVVEITFAGRLGGGPDGSSTRRPWSRAFLCWNDQYAEDAALHSPAERGSAEQVLHFLDREQNGYELVSAAPDLGLGALDRPAVAATGYAEFSARWIWRYGGATWSSAAPDLARYSEGGRATWSLRLLKSDPDTAPLPLLLFTDADFVATTAQQPSLDGFGGER